MFSSSENFSFVRKFQSAGSLFIFLDRGRKQLGHAHKFARYLLYRYLKRNGKSVGNDNLQSSDFGSIKAVIKILMAAQLGVGRKVS